MYPVCGNHEGDGEANHEIPYLQAEKHTVNEKRKCIIIVFFVISVVAKYMY